MNAMSITNVEIKAICRDLERIRKIILSCRANYIGSDHQVDHYYETPEGKLKLRIGNIEKALIFYRRQQQKYPKVSHINLYRTDQPESLDNVLSAALKKTVTVDKQREIYFINNIKIHLDTVLKLGTFIEIEAIDNENRYSHKVLLEQCQNLMKILKIQTEDLIMESYSDMLLKIKS